MKNIKQEGVQKTIGHINSIDGIRGLAVLMVVFFHYYALRASFTDDLFISLIQGTWLASIISHGHLGVDIFFMMTGFLLVTPWLAYKHKDRDYPSMKKYFHRRFFRIAPAYYLQLAILFFLLIPLIKGKALIFSDYGIENMLHHLFFTHYFTPVSSGSFGVNGALWTLSLEVQFYCVLPIIGYFLIRRFWTTIGILLLSSIVWRYISYTKETIISDFYMGIGERWTLPIETIQNFIGTQLFGYLGHFGLGIILAYLFIRKIKIPHKLAGGIAILSLFFLFFVLKSSIDLHLYSLLIPICLFGIFYYFIFFTEGALAKIISNKFLSYTGTISYSMYLYHFPLLIIFNSLPSSVTTRIISIFVYFIVLFIISHISYFYIELPFMSKKKK